MSRRPTLQDVAREACVSRSAAARVLLGTGGEHVRVSQATRERIQEAARRLQYSPNRLAQQLRGIASNTIGVILDTLNMPVMSQRLFALEREAARRGYRLLIGQTHGDPTALTEYAADFSGRAVEAILCLFDLSPGRDARARKAFAGLSRRVVFHARPAWRGGYCVRVDTAAAIHAALDHLAASGRRRLALWLCNAGNDELVALRREAFLSWLASRKNTRLRGIVCETPAESTNPSPEALDHGIDLMVRRHRADAILASNDIWATRLILQLRAYHMDIPRDVAVIGYDNLDIASVVTPSLTTIDQCHEDYARAALELMLRLARGEKIPPSQRIITISPRLILRNSA